MGGQSNIWMSEYTSVDQGAYYSLYGALIAFVVVYKVIMNIGLPILFILHHVFPYDDGC